MFFFNIYECYLSLQLQHNYEAMNINNLLATFEQRLPLQRYSDASIRNYKSAVDSFLRLAARKYQKPEELNAGKIEKYEWMGLLFRQGQKSDRKNHRKGAKTQRFCHPPGEGVGGKPANTGGDVAAAAKERPEEAPFAVLRPHDYRLRTWSRRPTAKPAPPYYLNMFKHDNLE